METPRGEYPSLQSKRLSPAVNCGPGQPVERFTVAIVICSVDNNTTVGHLSREFSGILWYFLTHGGEMNAECDGALHSVQAD